MSSSKITLSLRARKWISAFIIFHLLSIFSSALSLKGTLKYNPLMAAYLHFFGLYQHWVMFERAPESNNYIVFLLQWKDGRRELIEFAHMDELDQLSRLRMHRFRKFQQSSAFNPANRFLWKDLCLWFFNSCNDSDKSRIAEIELLEKVIPFSINSINTEPKFVLVYRFFPSAEQSIK
ncbi:MAG: hypothetical protein K2X27_07470 [Candidatus Obscuribacterales bacterium]|nr:hypothetical protein [Candidatus Obscuribacterales bacterium]